MNIGSASEFGDMVGGWEYSGCGRFSRIVCAVCRLENLTVNEIIYVNVCESQTTDLL